MIVSIRERSGGYVCVLLHPGCCQSRSGVCVDLDMSLSWLSANKFLKIWQRIGAGSSDWRRCHEPVGSGGSSRAWSGWLMTVIVVYFSPFVALSFQPTPRWHVGGWSHCSHTASSTRATGSACLRPVTVEQCAAAAAAAAWSRYLIWIQRQCKHADTRTHTRLSQATNLVNICLRLTELLVDPGHGTLSGLPSQWMNLNQMCGAVTSFCSHDTVVTASLLYFFIQHQDGKIT